jgi:hypothetical protein
MVFGLCLKICKMGQGSVNACLGLHLLKVWGLLKIRGDSLFEFGLINWKVSQVLLDPISQRTQVGYSYFSIG